MEKLNKQEYGKFRGLIKNVKTRFKKASKMCKIARKSLRIAKKEVNPSLSYEQLKNMARAIKEVEEIDDEDFITNSVGDFPDNKKLSIMQGIRFIPLTFTTLLNAAKASRQIKRTFRKIKAYEGLRCRLRNSEDEELQEVDFLISREEVRQSSWSCY